MIQDFIFGYFNIQDEWMRDLTVGYLALMVCLFALSCVWFMVPVIVRWIQIGINIHFVRMRVRDPEKIDEERGSACSQILKKTTWARPHFDSFYLTWEGSRLSGDSKAATPVELIEYLTPGVAMDGAVNRRIADVLPGIFVILGIFGTFLGLVLGMKGIKIDDIANLKQGVGQIISGLSLAFTTSLLGISLSIFFSICYRFLIRRLEKAIFVLNEINAKLFPYHPYEHYARQYMELQSDIKQGLQTLATDVATKISTAMAPALDQALSRNLVPILQNMSTGQIEILSGFRSEVEKMANMISGHFADSQRKQSEAMETVLSQYVEQMNSTFKSQFQDIGRILEETTKVQAETRGQMVRFTDHLEKQFQVQSELIEGTSRAGRILNESLDSLEGISKELKGSADDIASAAKLLEEAASKSKEGQEVLKDSMERQIQAMTTTRSELEKAWKTITQDANSTVELIRVVIRELAEGIGEQLNSALNAFDGKIAEVIERFSGTMFEANQVIQELPQILSQFRETLESIRSEIVAQRSILVEMASASKDVLGPNIEKAVSAFQGLSQVSENIRTSAVNLQTWLDSVLLQVQSNAGSFDKKSEFYWSELKNWSDDFLLKLHNSIEVFDEEGPLASSLKQLNDLIANEKTGDRGSTETQAAEVLGNLTGVIVELKACMQKLSEGDGQGNRELLKDVKELALTANAIAEKIKNEWLSELKGIGQSTGKVVVALDDLRQTISVTDAKKGILSWISRK